MKIGVRGHVTIPKEIRERFGLGRDTEVQFRVVRNVIVLKKTPTKLNLEKWEGKAGKEFAALGYASVDEFVENIRGR